MWKLEIIKSNTNLIVDGKNIGRGYIHKKTNVCVPIKLESLTVRDLALMEEFSTGKNKIIFLDSITNKFGIMVYD